MEVNHMPIPLVVKALLKRILNDAQQKVLSDLYLRLYTSLHRNMKSLYLRFYTSLFRNNLTRLAIAFRTDKEGRHHYAKHYQRQFESLRREKINLLEIGIGGYIDPRKGGESLRMWKAYFPKSHIFGIDIYDKTCLDENRIKTFMGSQTDEDFLRRVAAEIGTIDIIIDDGSHQNNHVITSFGILFPLLSPKGIYVIEDLQTSYWVEHGGSTDLLAPHTSMNFLKSLTDGLNYKEFRIDKYTPTYFDEHIISIHYYHNLVFIHKGKNKDSS